MRAQDVMPTPRQQPPTPVHAVHVCAWCGVPVAVDLHEFTAGARVVDGSVSWFCARHRESPASGFVWTDCPAAPDVPS